MASRAEIVARYHQLTAFCTVFWDRVAHALPGQLACRPGCSMCCELRSVNYLEALVIADYCARHPAARSQRNTCSISPEPDGSCPFLSRGRCGIYEARPLICRTHGLPLKGRSFREPLSITCPLNFTGVDLEAIDNSLVLDSEKLSDNLARLNAAFCMLLGKVEKASQRILLGDLAEGTVNKTFFKE
ncbi:MAG: YkgJ family cysteine cluster protein [Chitinispirillaceae bacterium]|nr:YkgJ family cysteine cluster protein [Chitinispirillaceae bacterium]